MEIKAEYDFRYRIICGCKWVDFWFKVAPTIFYVTADNALSNSNTAWIFDETGKMTTIILKKV